MHRLSEEQLREKLREAHSLGFIKEILIHEAKREEKVVGREILFNTGISNYKAKENRFLISSVKKGLKAVFGRSAKEKITSFGTMALSMSFGRMS